MTDNDHSNSAAPFLAFGAASVVGWANGWLNTLGATGLAHPNFDASHRKIAAVVGAVLCLAIVAMWRKSTVHKRRKVLSISVGCFIVSLICTFLIAVTIDYIADKETIVLLRKVWKGMFLLMSISLLTTISAAILFWYPAER